MKYCFECTEEIPDMQARQCPKCGAQSFAYNKDVLSRSVSIRSRTSDQVHLQPKDSSIQTGVVAGEPEIIRSDESEYLKQILERLNSTEKEIQKTRSENISAQNRTTHAVRSIAITFVAAPVISVIVLLADLLAFMSNNIGVIVMVSLIGVIILLVVLVRALTELGQSKVP